MNFKPAQLENALKNLNNKVKCIILFGTNEGEIAHLQKKCAEAVCEDINDAFSYCALEMDNISKDGQEVYAEFHAQSLMGGRRAIVVKNADNNLTNFLKGMLPDTPSDNLLILSSLSINTKSALITWAKEREDVIICGCYEDRESDMAASVSRILQENNLSISPSDLQLLCSRLSPDFKLNQAEIDKLEIYLGERKQITKDDIIAVISDVAGADFEDLCYYVGEGDVMRASKIYKRLINEGEEPATIIRQISYHFVRLLECTALMETGKNANDAIDSLRPKPMYYRKNSFIKQLGLWKRERLLSVLRMVYDCEKDCKTTGIPAEQSVSYTIMRIAGAAKKLKEKSA